MMNTEEKLKNGWIKSRIYIEIMATDRKLTEDSMKEHIAKLRGVNDSEILSEKYQDTVEVTLPSRKAFSQVVEIELLTRNIETLLYIVIFYAPSAVEVLEPKDLKIGMDQIQVIMNSVADLIHRYAAAGVGGVVITTKNTQA